MGSSCSKPDPYVDEVVDVVVTAKEKTKKIVTIDSKVPAEEQQHDGSNDKAVFKRTNTAAAVAGTGTGRMAGGAVHVPVLPKSAATMEMLNICVKGNMLFDELSTDVKERVFLSMTNLEVLANTTIIQQGDDEATKFYVLEQGVCEVLLSSGSAPKVVHTYKPGSCFGDLALLYNQPRAATVRATTPCKLWVMERAVYNHILRESEEQVRGKKLELIQNMPIFSTIGDKLQGLLCDALQEQRADAGQVLFYKGDTGNKFYVIKEGQVHITVGEKVVAKLGPGQYFGERALWKDNSPRAATAVTRTNCTFYTLTREPFQELLGPIDYIWRLSALKTVPILYNLSEAQMQELSAHLRPRDVAQGEVLIQQGAEGDTFYIIESGTFSCYKNDGTKLALVTRGSCFGELALLHNEKRACNVSCESQGRVLTLSRLEFNQLLGDLKQLRHAWRFEALRRVPLLQPLSHAARDQLCGILKPIALKAKDTIVKQGDDGDAFYIVEAGLLAVVKDGKPVMTLQPGQYFGELALLEKSPRAASVVATTDVALLKMSKADFESTMGPLSKHLASNAAKEYGLGAQAGRPKITLDGLKEIGYLGRGAFGSVTLVQHKRSYFALKQISKAQVVKAQLVPHIKAERQLLGLCDSPFLVHLEAAFKDEQNLYLLMEFVQGGELFSFMRKRKRALKEDWARFYAAAVICGFEYLQERNIVYRDLKPENLLIDTNGYLKITDFGFAKKLKPGSKTYTLCGTPEYLAPEVILQKGHDRAADWWTLGILIFELVAGLPPFYEKDRVKMFRKAVKGEVKFPANMSPQCADLIGGLLKVKPAQRLGMQRLGVAEIKSHAWFDGFDWKAFEARTMLAPYVPVVKSASDMRNFTTEKKETTDEDTGYVSEGLFADF